MTIYELSRILYNCKYKLEYYIENKKYTYMNKQKELRSNRRESLGKQLHKMFTSSISTIW